MGVIVHRHSPSPPPSVPTPPAPVLPFGQSVILAPPTPLVTSGGLLGGVQPASTPLAGQRSGSRVILHPPMAPVGEQSASNDEKSVAHMVPGAEVTGQKHTSPE